MATIVLHPIANINTEVLTPTGGTNYANLQSNDSFTTNNRIVSSWAAVSGLDVYWLPIFALGTIQSVSVTQITYGATGGVCWNGLRIPSASGITDYISSHTATSSSWQTYTDTWNTNPATGAAWTIPELASCLLLLKLQAEFGNQTWCTEQYVTVTYTPFGAASEIIYPTGNGSYTQITSQTPSSTNHYDKVDDSIDSPDGDSTTVSTSSTSALVDTYALSNLSSGSVLRINAVAVIFRGRNAWTSGPNSGFGKATVYTNGGLAYGIERDLNGNPDISLSYSYTTWGEVWTINPITGVAWTRAEVDALEAGVTLRSRSGGFITYCTQVTVIVSYTVDQAPSVPSTPSGTSNIRPLNSYSYSTSTTDPESDNIYYTVDWGDTTTTDSGWVSSGTSAGLSHTWSTPGTYSVRAKATDSLGAVSSWSSTLTVYVKAIGGTTTIICG